MDNKQRLTRNNSPKTPKKNIGREAKKVCTPLSIRLECVEYPVKSNSPKKYLSIKLEGDMKQVPKTPRSDNPFRKSRCSTPCCVKLEHLDNKLFTKKFTEMNFAQKELPRSSVTPKKIKKTKGSDVTTPQSQFSEELKKVLHERNILTCKTKKHVFDALDEIKTKNEEETKAFKREKALLEIFNSEKKYIHQLELIINFFLKPVQEKKILKSEDFQAMFGNITTIYNINRELLQELEENNENVAKAFWRVAPFLKVYSVYACEFKNILKILQNARALNPQFAKFVENQESRPEVQSKLSALLITPIQRVPRYKLLLAQLLQLTKPTEKDYNNLTECLERIEEAAEHINKIVDDQENMQRLLEIQRFLKSGEPTIVKPGRILIKEGILIKMATKDAPSEKLYTVLTNDIILFGKMKKDELKVNSLKCFSIFPLGKCKVLEILDKGCMKIICVHEEVILYNKQLSETRTWIEKIKECIDSHVSDRKTLRKDSSSRRPVKRKDLHEYHEAGVSPGRPLKKRKLEPDNINLGSRFKISGRKPITRTTVTFDVDKINGFNNVSENSRNSSVEPRSVSVSSSCSSMSTAINERPPATSTELFVFGRSHPVDSGFKVSKIIGGVGSSIKKLFGFGR